MAKSRSNPKARRAAPAIPAKVAPDQQQTPGPGTRQAMRFLEARVRAGQASLKEVEEARAFARKVLGLSGATRRDRLRACSLILTAAKHADEAAKTLNSIERELLYPAGQSVTQEVDEDESDRVRFEVVLKRRADAR